MVFHINLKIPVGPNLFTENSRNVGENLVSENFRSNPVLRAVAPAMSCGAL